MIKQAEWRCDIWLCRVENSICVHLIWSDIPVGTVPIRSAEYPRFHALDNASDAHASRSIHPVQKLSMTAAEVLVILCAFHRYSF